VTDVKTTLAMTTAEAKEVFAATGKLALGLPTGRRGQLTWSTYPAMEGGGEGGSAVAQEVSGSDVGFRTCAAAAWA
jgi:hypothetical protein